MIICIGFAFATAAIFSVAVLFCSILLSFVFHGIVAVVFDAVDGVVVVVVGACAAVIIIVVFIVSVVPVFDSNLACIVWLVTCSNES